MRVRRVRPPASDDLRRYLHDEHDEREHDDRRGRAQQPDQQRLRITASAPEVLCLAPLPLTAPFPLGTSFQLIPRGRPTHGSTR